MDHEFLAQARKTFSARVDAYDATHRNPYRVWPEGETLTKALNTWLYRGSTIRQAVELVFASALEGNPLT